MKHFTPEQKQIILEEYAYDPSRPSFSILASRHSVTGGRRTLQNWYQRWDGSVESLRHQKGAGRPRILDKRQVKQYIETPIRKANRSSCPIHYTNLHSSFVAKTHQSISLTTFQLYGQRDVNIKEQRTIPRTEHESK